MNDDFYQAMIKIYTMGMKFYLDPEWNIEPTRRHKMLHQALMGWNYYEGKLHGRRTA